jgi:tetraacyldisaccharide 4'-kinase
VLRAHLVPLPHDFAGRSVFAFAGIGRPQKFFDTLQATGAIVKGTQDFADHYLYDAQDLQGLRDQARGDLMVTTEKDLVRIAPEQRRGIVALAVEARFDDPAALEALLAKAMR